MFLINLSTVNLIIFAMLPGNAILDVVKIPQIFVCHFEKKRDKLSCRTIERARTPRLNLGSQTAVSVDAQWWFFSQACISEKSQKKQNVTLFGTKYIQAVAVISSVYTYLDSKFVSSSGQHQHHTSFEAWCSDTTGDPVLWNQVMRVRSLPVTTESPAWWSGRPACLISQPTCVLVMYSLPWICTWSQNSVGGQWNGRDTGFSLLLSDRWKRISIETHVKIECRKPARSRLKLFSCLQGVVCKAIFDTCHKKLAMMISHLHVATCRRSPCLFLCENHP